MIGKVLGKPYAFIGLERIGGVAVFDVSDPAAPKFIEYVNNRDSKRPAAIGGGQRDQRHDYHLPNQEHAERKRSIKDPGVNSCQLAADVAFNDQQLWPIYRESSDQLVDDIFKEFLASASMLDRIRVTERVFFQ